MMVASQEVVKQQCPTSPSTGEMITTTIQQLGQNPAATNDLVIDNVGDVLEPEVTTEEIIVETTEYSKFLDEISLQ